MAIQTRSDGASCVKDGMLTLDGEVTTLYGGAMHYWRIERNLWGPILDRIVAMGFTTVSIYIPWEVHEIERGRFDFGAVDERKDIDAFLSVIESKGLRIIARPGPQINSELTGFGYPRRILANDRLHARSAKGSRYVLTQVPCAIPGLSYACEEFFQETALWYDAICPILAKHAYPHGGLVAAQVDNEMAYFFGVNAYSSDYHPESLAWYREFVLAKYGDLAGANLAYGKSWATEQEIDPPRRSGAKAATDIPYYADWAEYREVYLVRSLGRLADMMRERGLGSIPLFHNYPHPLGPGGSASGFTAPFNLTALEKKLDFVGFDIYSRKELYGHIKTVISYVVGTSRFPYIPEFIAGVWPWYMNPGDAGDEEFVTKAALMNGVRGFSRYMLVERDKWFDSPIRRDGRVRPEKVDMLTKANIMLTKYDLKSTRRTDPVLLLANREYDRLEAASVLVSFPGDFLETPSGFSEYAGAVSVSEDALGFAQPIQMEKGVWFTDSADTLHAIKVNYLISDTGAFGETLAGRPIVVVGTFDYLDAATQQKLLDYAKQGGHLVIGPVVPRLDSLMQGCTLLADALAGQKRAAIGAGSISRVGSQSELSLTVTDLVTSLDNVWVKADANELDVITHADLNDPDRFIVWAVNPTNHAVSANIDLGFQASEITDIWTGEAKATSLSSVTFAPYSIHVCQVRRAH